MKISITIEITKGKNMIQQMARRLRRLEKASLTENKFMKELNRELKRELF